MDVRTKFMLVFWGICLTTTSLLFAWVLLFPHMPVLRWAPLFLVAAYFVIVFWLFRHYRGRLPRPTQEQKLNAARSIRRLAWFFFAAPILGLLAGWQDIASLPHGVGFLIPLIPILLGAYYLRLSIKLSRTVTDSNTLNQIGE